MTLAASIGGVPPEIRRLIGAAGNKDEEGVGCGLRHSVRCWKER